MKINILISKRKDKFVYEVVGFGHCGNGQDALYGTKDTFEEAVFEVKSRYIINNKKWISETNYEFDVTVKSYKDM